MNIAATLFLLTVCAAAQSQPSAAQSTAAPVAKASLSGKVVNAVTGEPLRKASVMLASVVSGSQQARTAVTDDQGGFSFMGLEPANYRMIVIRNGYIRQTYGERDAGPYRGPGSSITLKPGEDAKGILVRLQPAAAISGRVVDEDGEPLMHARVQAMRWNYVRGRRELVPAGTDQTNDRGEYRIYDLSPGRYYLSATYEGGYLTGYLAGIGVEVTDQTFVPVFYPGVNDAAQASPLDIRGGDDLSGINFMITPQRAVAVAGRVFNSVTGQAGRYVHLNLVPRATAIRGFRGDYDTNTDEHGMFRFRGVAPGSYMLTAQWDGEGQGPGMIITSANDELVTHYNRRHYSGRQAVEVGSADLEGVNVVIAPGTDVPGAVKIEGTLPPPPSPSRPSEVVVMGTRVMSERSTPAIRVMLDPMDDSSIGSVVANLKPDNSFVLENVPEGMYRISVAGLPGGAYLKSARLGGQDVLEDGVTIARGRRVTLDLVISTLTGTVDGVALDSSGKPFGGARIVLIPEDARRKRPNLYRTAIADAYGRFALRSVPPGDYKLFAWDTIESGAYQDPDFLRPFEDMGQLVRVTENSQVTAELKVIVTEQRLAQ